MQLPLAYHQLRYWPKVDFHPIFIKLTYGSIEFGLFMWVCFPILFESITIQKVSMQVSTNHILKTKNKYHFRSVPKLSSNAKAVFHFLSLFFEWQVKLWSLEHTFPFLCYQEHAVFGKLWHLESGLMCPQTLQPTIHQRVRMTSLLLASTKAFFNKCRRIFQYQEIGKILPRVRIELTTFRLWDWRAAYCAIEAPDYCSK